MIKATGLVIVAAVLGGAAYFGLRSKEERENDLDKVKNTAKRSYSRVREFGSNLMHTERVAA
jgi:hypothetical protein